MFKRKKGKFKNNNKLGIEATDSVCVYMWYVDAGCWRLGEFKSAATIAK